MALPIRGHNAGETLLRLTPNFARRSTVTPLPRNLTHAPTHPTSPTANNHLVPLKVPPNISGLSTVPATVANVPITLGRLPKPTSMLPFAILSDNWLSRHLIPLNVRKDRGPHINGMTSCTSLLKLSTATSDTRVSTPTADDRDVTWPDEFDILRLSNTRSTAQQHWLTRGRILLLTSRATLVNVLPPVPVTWKTPAPQVLTLPLTVPVACPVPRSQRLSPSTVLTSDMAQPHIRLPMKSTTHASEAIRLPALPLTLL